MLTDYRICTRCVMDTSDPDIEFDADGVCNHCHDYDRLVEKKIVTGAEAERQLSAMVAEMKEEGVGKEYDCIIGVSGGVDSTYVAYKVKELGLRPLALHLDNGWDSELAAANIHKALNILGVDLYTHVIDWEEFKDLQVAFLKASTPDSEIPSDHAIVSLMYQMAAEKGVPYVIIGRNVRTETHVAAAWSMGHMDWKYIKSVHDRFGTVPLKTYPHRTSREEHRYSRRQVWIDILDYVDYVKKDAIKVLEQELGWQYYGGKHYESIYTRFFQGYILPKKFGYDKRRGHSSSLICSGEMTRAEALAELKKPPYPVEQQEADRVYVVKKLGLTEAEFAAIMAAPRKTIYDYRSYTRDSRRLLNRVWHKLYWGSRHVAKKVLVDGLGWTPPWRRRGRWEQS